MWRELSKEEKALDKKHVERAQRLIPGGAHTYSRGEDQFPASAPKFIVRGEKGHIWDNHGREFVDFGLALWSVILGHADPEVAESVCKECANGNGFSRPTILESEAAEDVISFLAPWADMVKFAKNGSDVTAAAVRLARAYTGRKIVVRCAEQPFFSFYDWFIADTAANAGIPEEFAALTKRFSYNDLASLERVIVENPGNVAAVIMEPIAFTKPIPGFLEGVRNLCTKHGCVLIFDEMISGLRFLGNSAHAFASVVPDLATFGKAIGNTHSVSCLVGKREIMELGGLSHDKPRVFLVSCTHGAEVQGLAALRSTLRIFERDSVYQKIELFGDRLRKRLNEIIGHYEMNKFIIIDGFSARSLLRILDHNGSVNFEFQTLFMDQMFRNGIFLINLAFCRDHTDEDAEKFCSAFECATKTLKSAVERKSIQGLYDGPVIKPVFRKFN